jgi:hypothetical protein
MRPKPGRSYSAENGLEFSRSGGWPTSGQAAAAEAVHEHLATVGAGRLPSQRLQRLEQLVGVVGERVERVTLDDDRAGALLSGEAEHGLAHVDLLLNVGEDERGVDPRLPAAFDLDVGS